MSIKILHCSDLHFDSPFTHLSKAQSDLRKEELRETFSEIIRIAKEEQVDALLIAGDLFDNDAISSVTINHLINGFKSIPEIKIFISPGNHDPYHEKSYYSIIDWPSNVHIFKGDLEKYNLENKGVVIYGSGFTNKYQRTPLIEAFKVENPELINLMLLHGEVVNNETKSDFNPISTSTIEKSGLDYLALGHTHDFFVERRHNSAWAYSGSPMGRGFDECGNKGIIIAEVQKGHVDIHFKPISKRNYYMKEVDVTGVTTYEEIVLRIQQELVKDVSYANHLYKIVLKGEVHLGLPINKSILLNKMKDTTFYIKIEDQTKLRIDLDQVAKEYTLKGIFVSKMLEKINGAKDEVERQKYKKALDLGLTALAKEEVLVG